MRLLLLAALLAVVTAKSTYLVNKGKYEKPQVEDVKAEKPEAEMISENKKVANKDKRGFQHQGQSQITIEINHQGQSQVGQGTQCQNQQQDGQGHTQCQNQQQDGQ